MKTKIIVITVSLLLLGVGIFFFYYKPTPQPILKPPIGPPPEPQLRQVSFATLPGWGSTNFKKSLQTFQISCKAFVRQDPERFVGTDQIKLYAKDWQPACQAALKFDALTQKDAREFFQHWFRPFGFYDENPLKGLFTGYYMPLLKGSYKKTEQFQVPLYEVPDDLLTLDLNAFVPHLKNYKLVGRISGKKVVPYYTREQINKGAIKGHAKVLLWIHSPIDRLFLEIQGSGIIETEDGKKITVGYDGQNGAPYTAIAGVLIKKGVMTKHNASMQAIKRYLEARPDEMDKIINQNKSFIFFRKLSSEGALGSQGVVLTPGYSLAIDRQWIPMGAPLWLSTTRPQSADPNVNKPLQRLMIAQDTGGAIKGRVRGDVFWGGGDKATSVAGHMKNEGHYWLLLPHQAQTRLAQLENDAGTN